MIVKKLSLFVYALLSLSSLRALEKYQTLLGHTGAVLCVAISPDGTLLASGSADHTIKLWKLHGLPTSAPVSTLVGHEGPVQSVGWAAGTRQIRSYADDHTACVWDTESEFLELELPFEASSAPHALWHPKDLTLAYIADVQEGQGLLSIIDATNPAKQVNLAFQGPLIRSTLTWDAEGKRLAVMRANNEVLYFFFYPDGSFVKHCFVPQFRHVAPALAFVPDLRYGPTVSSNVPQITAMAYGPKGTDLAKAQLPATCLAWGARGMLAFNDGTTIRVCRETKVASNAKLAVVLAHTQHEQG